MGIDRSNYDLGWQKFFTTNIENWISWMRFYMTKYNGAMHLVFYENLKSNLRAELQRITKFLELPTDCKRLWCASTSEWHSKFQRKVSDTIDGMCKNIRMFKQL